VLCFCHHSSFLIYSIHSVLDLVNYNNTIAGNIGKREKQIKIKGDKLKRERECVF